MTRADVRPDVRRREPTPEVEPVSVAAAWQLWPSLVPLRCLLLAATALFLLICVQQLGQPYVIDEAEFPYIAEATSRSGLPIYYHGELRPADVGIFHPPLYVYALGGWIQALGDSHAAVRGFGVICALLTAACGAATIRLLVPRAADVASVAFVALYLLNPLTIASALLPDIDGTVGVLALTLGLHVLVLLVVMRTPQRWQLLAAGAALGFAFSTKLTTPLALVPLMGLAFLLSPRRPARAAGDFALAVLLGIALFLAWWGPLAGSTTLDFRFPFQFTYDSLVGKSGQAGLSERLAALRPNRITLFWLDPLLLLIAAAALVTAAVRSRTDRTARAMVLVALFALGTVAMYDVITTPVFRFPKYWIAAVPAATRATVWLVAQLVPRRGVAWRSRAAPFLVGGALTAAVPVCVVAFTRVAELGPPYQPLRPVVGTLVALVALSAMVAAAVRTSGGSGARVAFPVAVACALAVGLHGLGQSLVQRSADYSTRYYYGERGFEQAVIDARSLTPAGEALLSPKDIGYEADRPFYEDAQLFGNPAALRKLLLERTAAVAVTRKDFDYSESVYPEAFAVVREYMVPVFDRPGSGFVVWRLRAAGASS